MSLPSHLHIAAQVRRLVAQGVGVYVLHRGDAERGMALIRSTAPDGTCRIHTREHASEPMDKAAGDAYVARAQARDPDLWIIEVEDPECRNIFDNP